MDQIVSVHQLVSNAIILTKDEDSVTDNEAEADDVVAVA